MKLTQRRRLRNLFERRPGQEIPLPEIADMRIMQYGRVISELRRGKKDKLGNYIEKPMDIQNRTQFKDGMQHSWFRWMPEPKVQKEMEFVKG